MLAIIPARRDSKGIPGKALRTIGGIPLILRTLRTVQASRVAKRILVSTDCPEIESFCRLRGYEVLRRPDALGADDVPLIDVARHVIDETKWKGTVGIFQPTCPLLRPETVRDVVSKYARWGFEWAITIASDPHIHWTDEGGIRTITPRVQRQDSQIFVETGAIQLMHAAAMEYEQTDRHGIFPRTPKWTAIPIPPREALDIDTPDDLMLAEKLCSLRNIHFVVLMGERVGTGHFHRSLALAQSLSHHSISWEWRGDPPGWAVERVPYPERQPDGPVDVLIFDCLRPGESEVLEARSNGVKVVALEDESGDLFADLTINDMLDIRQVKYAVLRSEFLCLPEREQPEVGAKVLVTFGGTDPARLTHRCMRLMAAWNRKPGLPSEMRARMPSVNSISPGRSVQMAEAMRDADLVITSQGRTVFEAAACGTPCISIAANEREARHVRIPGVTYLGLHSTVTDDQIRHAVRTTLDDKHLREENAQAAREAVDGRGLDRLTRRVEELIAD